MHVNGYRPRDVLVEGEGRGVGFQPRVLTLFNRERAGYVRTDPDRHTVGKNCDPLAVRDSEGQITFDRN